MKVEYLAQIVCSICTPYQDSASVELMFNERIRSLETRKQKLEEKVQELQGIIKKQCPNKGRAYFLDKIGNMIQELGSEYIGRPLTDDEVSISLQNLREFYPETHGIAFRFESDTLSAEQFKELDNKLTHFFGILRNPEYANLARLFKSLIKLSLAKLPLMAFITVLDEMIADMLLKPDLYPNFQSLTHAKHAQILKKCISAKHKGFGSFILSIQDSETKCTC